MANDSLHRPSFSPTRKWASALNVLASSAALVALVLMVNYLAGRHFKRYQWMADERFRLSPMTVKMLEALTNQVKVIVFFDPQMRFVIEPGTFTFRIGDAKGAVELTGEVVEHRQRDVVATAVRQ